MSELDILKLLQRYGEETDISDFSPDELQQLLEEMQNGDEPLPETFASFKEKYFEHSGKIYANPTEEQLKEAGYKPLTVTDMPECDENHFCRAVYEETETEIIKKWENGEITLDEANEQLKGKGIFIDPEKNVVKEEEKEKYGELDTGTGSLDRVEIKDGKLVHNIGHMYAMVKYMGKWYDVINGETLVERA